MKQRDDARDIRIAQRPRTVPVTSPMAPERIGPGGEKRARQARWLAERL